MCDNFGYYTVTQGYRKVPGDRCIGGLDLNPLVYSCSYSGLIFGFLSFKGFIMTAIIGAALYYFWGYVEALILLLPIPDPKDIKNKVLSLFARSKDEKATAGVPKKP